MKAIFAVIFVFFGLARAGGWGHGAATLLGAPAPGALLQGPSSKTTIVGPDGSHVVAAAAGGAVAAPPTPGGGVSAAVAPGAVLHGAVPLVAPLIAPAVAFAPAVAAAPAILPAGVAPSITAGHGGAVIRGPSGTVFGSAQPGGWVGGHGAAAIGAAAVVGASAAHGGQWVPDGTEGLYDDGSYHGDYHGDW